MAITQRIKRPALPSVPRPPDSFAPQCLDAGTTASIADRAEIVKRPRPFVTHLAWFLVGMAIVLGPAAPIAIARQWFIERREAAEGATPFEREPARQFMCVPRDPPRPTRPTPSADAKPVRK